MIRRQGIDFFPVMTFCDVRSSLFLARTGAEGYGILMRLLGMLYGGEGYYLAWSDDAAMLLGQECSVSPEKVRRVVLLALRGGIFDQSIFDRCSILTSRDIQRTFVNAASRRKRVILDPDYALIPLPEVREEKYCHKKVTSTLPSQSIAEQSRGAIPPPFQTVVVVSLRPRKREKSPPPKGRGCSARPR